MIQAIFVVSLLIFQSNAQKTSHTSFSCEQRPSGYYADLETGCQVYHMCDGLGRQFSYSCPNATLFQQRMLICDHWYMVNCSKSEVDYRANLLIGQRDKPFLEDSEKHPYHRTPRPDLLANYKMPDYNLIHRNGRSQNTFNYNLVGIETDPENNSSSSTDQPFYSLPSHWFTEYTNTDSTQKEGEKSYYAKPKHTKIINDTNRKLFDENYKTKMKTVINDNTKFKFQSNIESNTEAFVTTLQNRRYKEKLSDSPNTTAPFPNTNHSAHVTTTQFPNLDAYLLNSKMHKNNDYFVKPIPKKTLLQDTRNNEMHWKDLRKLFLIPDYEFPLDSASRPGYENGRSSFEVNSSMSSLYKK